MSNANHNDNLVAGQLLFCIIYLPPMFHTYSGILYPLLNSVVVCCGRILHLCSSSFARCGHSKGSCPGRIPYYTCRCGSFERSFRSFAHSNGSGGKRCERHAWIRSVSNKLTLSQGTRICSIVSMHWNGNLVNLPSGYEQRMGLVPSYWMGLVLERESLLEIW